jgi:hypothetical protein
MLAIPKMGVAKDLPANSLAGSTPVTLSASRARDIQQVPFRIVHLQVARRRRSQCAAATAAPRHCTLGSDGAEFEAFREVPSCPRSLGDPVEPNSD